MEILQVDKLNSGCCCTQTCTYGSQSAVLPEPLLKKTTVSCLTSEKIARQPFQNNLCLFGALALHLHGKTRVEEKISKIYNLFKTRIEVCQPDQFQGVHMIDLPIVEDRLRLNIFLREKDSVDGTIIGELVRGILQKYEKKKYDY